MIIIGDNHKFSEFELKILKLKHKRINFIQDINDDFEVITNRIESSINGITSILIVLNVDGTIPSKLLTYLTKIEHSKDVYFLTIDSFLELELKKMFVPKKLTNLRFLEKAGPYTNRQYIIKRAIDYVAVVFILALSWPIIIYAIYRISKDSPVGPVLFKQKRIGLRAKEFVCIKFRSMEIDAEKNGAQFSSKDDPRVFSWGKTMRKTRIDELPQLINVLKGEMHLIGPRPERKIWVDQFENEIPYYSERHLVRPGITGWAQVKYPYGENKEDARQKLMYDLFYMKEWSLKLEVLTVLKTIRVILSRSGM